MLPRSPFLVMHLAPFLCHCLALTGDGFGTSIQQLLQYHTHKHYEVQCMRFLGPPALPFSGPRAVCSEGPLSAIHASSSHCTLCLSLPWFEDETLNNSGSGHGADLHRAEALVLSTISGLSGHARPQV